MNESSPLWRQIAPSEYPWERDALDFVRRGLPDHEPHRAWANFEIVSEDGSIQEIDLLVLTPKGLFLVEIKSWSGTLDGDASTWTVLQDGRVHTHDSPLILANRKARRLASLLKKQKALRNARNVRPPYVEPLVFLSNPGLQMRLSGTARQGVHTRDTIMNALLRFEASDLVRTGKVRLDRPTAKAVSRALEEAGVRPTQRIKRAGDFVLDSLLESGPDHQDWQAHHVSSDRLSRRIRIYTVGHLTDGGSEARARLERAARREIEALEAVSHPGLLKPLHLTHHDLGPALVFEHDPKAVRLDHFLTREKARLGFQERLALVRQVAETLRYVHEKHLYHRALSPRSILVFEPDGPSPRLRLLNWQTAAHESLTAATSGAGRLGLSGTSHLDSLVEEEARVYLAPEAFTLPDAAPETLDVFSLGALAFFLFSGRPPAASVLELHERLRAGQGLQLASVLDGAPPDLSTLIQIATHPRVEERWPSVAEFLEELEKIEKELPRPGEEYVSDHLEAKTGDRFREGFLVKSRLGKGSTSVVFLVERNGQEQVLKLALNEETDAQVRAEAEVLRRLKHPRIVQLQGTITVCGRAGLLLPYAESTVAQRLRSEGRFQIEFLQRFGEDLLQAVSYLEREGVPHRDVKPDNLGLMKAGRNTELHAVLFDFSLSSAPADRIFAGTRPYLDPFLRHRKPPRWDLQAERFSVGVTLYEMATGTLPRWGNGQTDPGMIDDEVRVESELMDAAVREPLTRFFEQALRRDPGDRFDNAEEMLAAWRRAFEEADRPLTTSTSDEPPLEQTRAELEAACARAHLGTSVSLLSLSTRAVNALERAEVETVNELLKLRPSEIQRMRGVGSKTRRELQEAIDLLSRHLGPPVETSTTPPVPESDLLLTASIFRLDVLARSLLPMRAEGERRILEALLGISPEAPASSFHWPSQSEVAESLGLTRARVSQVLIRARERWQRSVSLTQVRDQLAQSIQAKGGVAVAEELVETLLETRGSAPEEPLRTAFAVATLRAASEVEENRDNRRWKSRRTKGRLLLALTETEGETLLDSVEALGRKADDLARQDPLPSPQRVLETFQELFQLLPLPLSADRLLSLAAGTSSNAALSSRMELYPRDLPPDRALRLASGSLLGAQELTVEEIRNRVASRFPEAPPLPGHPRLGELLTEAGLGFRWSPEAGKGQGAYRLPPPPLGSTFAPSTTYQRSTASPSAEPSSEDVEARLFEDRLLRSSREGSFLALVVDSGLLLQAEERLAHRFPVERVSLEERWLEALRRLAHEYGVDWEFVLQADARPAADPDAVRLRQFAAEALKQVEDELRQSSRTVLLTRPGLLARYSRMELLERLRDRLSRRGAADETGPHGLWVLVPMEGSSMGPMIDGEALPVITPALWARVPEPWIRRETMKETV